MANMKATHYTYIGLYFARNNVILHLTDVMSCSSLSSLTVSRGQALQHDNFDRNEYIRTEPFLDYPKLVHLKCFECVIKKV